MWATPHYFLAAEPGMRVRIKARICYTRLHVEEGVCETKLDLVDEGLVLEGRIYRMASIDHKSHRALSSM